MFRLILSIFALINTSLSLEVNSSYMYKYLDYIKEYNKVFDYDNFLNFKDNILLDTS